MSSDSAISELVDVLYGELHRMAAAKLRGERTGHTLQPTALVNEAYMKLAAGQLRQFENRVHFLAVASRVMRQVLVDHARARSAQKRAKDAVPLTTGVAVSDNGVLEPVDLLHLNRSLDELALEDKALADLVEMRYFGGLTAEETAQVTGRSAHAVRRDLRLAQAWLRRQMAQ